jgi:protein O-mannosyl-transferase
MKRPKHKKPVKSGEASESGNKVRVVEHSPSVSEPDRSQRVPQILIALVLIALVVAIYYPVRHYGFVDLDDPQYVSENPHVADGLTWTGVNWAFTSIYASYWLPLIWLSHMLDVQLYGLNAGGHHVTNVVFHIANTVLLFLLLRRMTGDLPRSAFVAAMFGVHPLHVESVVWITERKDVLSTLLWLLTMWAYVDYARRRRSSRYLLMVGFFILGLMAKGMLVTLPFVLLLMDVWPLHRLQLTGWRLSREQVSLILALVREKLPLFALAIISSIVTYVATTTTGAVASVSQIPLNLRAANAVISYVRYIAQMFWPARLALFYPYPLSLPAWQIASCAAFLIGVTVMVVWQVRQRPYLLVGWLWYLGTLVPVIGLIQAGDQARADRFTYVPLIGVFMMIAWGIPDVRKLKRSSQIVAVTAALILTVACAFVARIQVGYWENKISIWEHALAVADESYIAHTNLGIARYEQGKVDEAIMHYRAALRLRPDFAEAHNDLGVALNDKGQIDEAINEFLDGLRAKPAQAASHYNVAVLLARKGDTATAVQHLETALQLNPDYADARRELDRLRGTNTNVR